MYFKISLLFCALYFFTAVRTIGLSEQQINLCVQLSMKYNKSNNEINYFRRRPVLDSTVPTTAVADNRTMPELLIHLASVEKESDDWEEKSLTTFEVRIFVGLFTIQDQKGDHDGLLTYAELVSLINNDLTLEPDVKENIKNEFDNGDSINAQKFLAAILKHKPGGKGLDKKQIQICSSLYTCGSNHLPTGSLKDLLKTLHIVSNDYNSLLEVEHFQTAANELKELLVFWSEYNKDVNESSLFFTNKEVREYISDFSMYDRNNDGVLNFREFIPIAKLYFGEYNAKDVYKKYSDFYFSPEIPEFRKKLVSKSCFGGDSADRLDVNCLMSAAEFLYMKYYLRFERQPLQLEREKKSSSFLCCFGH